MQRLGAGRADKLLPYVRGRVPLDTETKRRVTANPLMLSMVVSVFELRQGLEMPETVAELYGVAASAMVMRADDIGRSERALHWRHVSIRTIDPVVGCRVALSAPLWLSCCISATRKSTRCR